MFATQQKFSFTQDEDGVEGVDVVGREKDERPEERPETRQDQKNGVRNRKHGAEDRHRDDQGEGGPHHVDGVEGRPEADQLLRIVVQAEVFLDVVEVDCRLTYKWCPRAPYPGPSLVNLVLRLW